MATYLAILARLILDFLGLAALCWAIVGVIVLTDRRRFPRPASPPDTRFLPAVRPASKVRRLGVPVRTRAAGRSARTATVRRIDG